MILYHYFQIFKRKGLSFEWLEASYFCFKFLFQKNLTIVGNFNWLYSTNRYYFYIRFLLFLAMVFPHFLIIFIHRYFLKYSSIFIRILSNWNLFLLHLWFFLYFFLHILYLCCIFQCLKHLLEIILIIRHIIWLKGVLWIFICRGRVHCRFSWYFFNSRHLPDFSTLKKWFIVLLCFIIYLVLFFNHLI